MDVMDASCGLPGHQRQPIFNGSYSFNTGHVRQLHTADYAVLFVILILSTIIGLFHFLCRDRQQLAIEEFLMAGRQVNPLTVGLSMTASLVSAVSLIGMPGEIYHHSTMYFYNIISFLFAMSASAHIYMPVFYNLSLTTAYEYLELRFNKRLRTIVSCLFVVQAMCFVAVNLYAPSLAVNKVTGFNMWGSILSAAFVTTLYTASGGMKAVLWTDSFQILMILVGMAALLWGAAVTVGSWDPMWTAMRRTNRVVFNDFQLDPSIQYTVWSTSIANYFAAVAYIAVNQIQVQRVLVCNTLRDAQIATWLVFPMIAVIFFMGSTIGLYMSAFYENCDPVKAGLVSAPDQLAPLFAMDILGGIPGLPGLYLAGLCCGAMSSISSAINSMSGAVFHDCIQNYTKHYIGETNTRRTLQLLSVFFTLCSLIIAICVSRGEDLFVLTYIIHGLAGAPVFGVFSLGMLFPWANTTGAYSGLLGSILCVLAVVVISSLSSEPDPTIITCLSNCNPDILPNSTLRRISFNGSNIISSLEESPPLFYIAFTWLAPISFVSCIVIGLAVSFATGPNDPTSISPRLMVLLSDVFPFKYLPESCRHYLRLGVPKSEKRFSWPSSSGSSSDIGTRCGSWSFPVPGSFMKTSSAHPFSQVKNVALPTVVEVSEHASTDVDEGVHSRGTL